MMVNVIYSAQCMSSEECRCSAAIQWFCNGSVYTEPSVMHTDGSVIVLYGSVIKTKPKVSWN